ncbi:DUF1735 and LamG domain-containing protein [Marinifilum sp.]|uniref:DUF1735 and LamG domain-containing protein n=1 Tax=Marinifilum sp. TaxID=2033137 RepID=UPI003BA8856B
MMKHYILYSFLFLMILFCGCEKDDDSFDNKVYLNAASKVDEILLKGGVEESVMKISAAIAKPEMQNITVTYKADPSLVYQYNQAYYDKAIKLPSANYSLEETQVEIALGNVKSKDTEIKFINLSALDRDLVYVLPVSISDANIPILESARTLYFVIKGAALINVVGDIEENYLEVNWVNPDVCNNLSQLTMEALIRARDYDRLISTVMGIEGRFLIRIGDAGFPSNQIQIATNRGNFPNADSNKGLPTNEWVHIALTYDSADGSMIVYVNGVKQSEGVKDVGLVNLGIGGSNGFLIGKSYANDRFLAGEIAECRIWNVVRTGEEIANNPYFVAPDSEGLVAYWKFNEGSGDVVEDQTGNGNFAKAVKPIIWNPVTLPAPADK